jgi:putative intracellular protease/amidase
MDHTMTVAAPDAGLQLTAEQKATLAALKQIRDQAGGALCAVCGAAGRCCAALPAEQREATAARAPASCGCEER